ncbi:MAG: hypothetical protein IJW19_04100 [Clostridia bacterium]|nr:hypothetical protein [Clostridia bacterium]
MGYYRFYDTDPYGNEEYDIAGEQYRELIRVCCEHSKYMSFIIYDKRVSGYDELCKYKIESIEYTPEDKYSRKYEILYCSICKGLQNFLMNNVDSVFEWILGRGFSNPEDPMFFREDGTIFFSSSIHDGIITLRPREENVSNIVCNPLWICSNNDIRGNKMLYKTVVLPYSVSSDSKAIELSESIMDDLKQIGKVIEYKFFGLFKYKQYKGYDLEFHCKMSSEYYVFEYVILNIRITDNKCNIFIESAE